MKSAIRFGLGIAIGRTLYTILCFCTGLWAFAVIGLLMTHQWLLAALFILVGWGLNRLFWRYVS